MAKEKKEKKRKLLTKYRFAIMDDASHKNLFVFRGSRLTIIIVSTIVFLLLLTAILSLISYTPLKQLIPGFPSPQTRKEAIQNAAKVDSLEREIQLWSLQLTNIQRVITGKEPLKIDSLTRDRKTFIGNDSSGVVYSKEDSLLRETIIKEEKFNLSSSNAGRIEQIEGLLFFPPVKGAVTEQYSKALGHPYIDIAAPENSIVSSVLDGTVIFADWSDDTGYTIQVQHSNDIISVYKHNTRLLKKTGDKVSAGTPISLVGNTGKLSTGAHLHFELWHKGEPIDPTLYIKF